MMWDTPRGMRPVRSRMSWEDRERVRALIARIEARLALDERKPVAPMPTRKPGWTVTADGKRKRTRNPFDPGPTKGKPTSATEFVDHT